MDKEAKCDFLKELHVRLKNDSCMATFSHSRIRTL